jgi:hypothetical protein
MTLRAEISFRWIRLRAWVFDLPFRFLQWIEDWRDRRMLRSEEKRGRTDAIWCSRKDAAEAWTESGAEQWDRED